MTTITYKNEDGLEVYKLVGHADYNPGNDLVCAGISTVTYGFINYIEEAELENKIMDLTVCDTPGNFYISFKILDFPEYESIKHFVMSTFKMISDSFPNNVFIGGSH